MKIRPNCNSLTALDAVKSSSPIKVCMHVLRPSRFDVRAMRAAHTLIKAGYEVTIVDVETESETIPLNEIDISGIVIKHITMPSSFIRTRFENGIFINVIQLFIRSIFRLFQTSADIYHASEVTALPASYLVARLRRKPLIFEAYELPLLDRPLSEMSKSRRLFHKGLAIFLTYVVPRCAGVIAVSPPIVERLRNQYHISKVSLLRNVPMYQAVPKSNRMRQYLGLGPETRIALYQGMLSADRGLDRLIRTARFLMDDIVIVMMGSGPKEVLSELTSLITYERVEDRVKIIPAVPYEELLSWTISADIGLIILPPDYSLSMRMCLPNKLFEYLMVGLPILASQLDAVGEVIRAYDVGQVVPSLAPADIAVAINAMLADPEALARMRHNALKAAQHEFNWEKESRHLIRFYQDVADVAKDIKYEGN